MDPVHLAALVRLADRDSPYPLAGLVGLFPQQSLVHPSGLVLRLAHVRQVHLYPLWGLLALQDRRLLSGRPDPCHPAGPWDPDCRAAPAVRQHLDHPLAPYHHGHLVALAALEAPSFLLDQQDQGSPFHPFHRGLPEVRVPPVAPVVLAAPADLVAPE